MKNIIEKQLSTLASLDNENKLRINPCGGAGELFRIKEIVGRSSIDSVDDMWVNCFLNFEKHGCQNYVLGKEFFKCFHSSIDRFDSDKIKGSHIYSRDGSFQITTPDGFPDLVIEYKNGTDGNFNIIIYSFETLRESIIKGRDDFYFYILKINKDETLEEIRNKFLSNPNLLSDTVSREELLDFFRANFNLWVSLILYLKTGRPDIRYMKGHKKVCFNNRKRFQKLRKYQDVSFSDFFLVGFEWKKETIVNPHFQGYWVGEGRSEYIIKFKNSFVRGGK